MRGDLCRSQTDRVLGGVCGGLGNYFDIDPILFRVLFFVFGFAFIGLLFYSLLWIVLPQEDDSGFIPRI